MATRMRGTEGVQPRIIVDCTLTFHTGGNTGIQRLVRRFSAGLLAEGGARGIEVVPVRIEGGVAVPLPLDEEGVRFPASDSVRAVERPAAPGLADRLRSLGHRANALRSRRLARWLDAGPNAPGLGRAVATLSPPATPADALPLRAGDVVVLLDSSWVYDVRTLLDRARAAGATTTAVICDVLPVSDPQWFTEGTRAYFHGWLEALLPRLDAVVAISRHTCSEIARLAGQGALRTSHVPPCTAVHLGAEMPAENDGAVRAELRARFAAGEPPALLTVGTLEPRKNVEYVLDILDCLEARTLDFQWHIVGAPGWLADHTAQRIAAHPLNGTRLFWWRDLRDAELAYAYRHAAALVAASRAEGFGLPLVEARMLGVPVFASDIAVFREVLGDEARYLPLDSPALAAAPIEDFLRGRGERRSASRLARPWRECAAGLMDAVLAARPQARP